MNFDATKRYGEFVNDIAKVLASTDDIYKAAESFSYDNMQHYMNARLAFTELLAYYPHDNEVVSFVIDEYVATDKTEVFFTKVSRSPKAKVEFVKRDLGNQHMLLCHIQLFLHTLMVISHPDRFEDGQLKIAVEKVAKPLVENNETNNAVFAYCYRHEYLKQAAIHKETTEKKKYIIGNEELFSKIYHLKTNYLELY